MIKCYCWNSTDKNTDNHFDLRTTTTTVSGSPWATASKWDLSSTGWEHIKDTSDNYEAVVPLSSMYESYHVSLSPTLHTPTRQS